MNITTIEKETKIPLKLLCGKTQTLFNFYFTEKIENFPLLYVPNNSIRSKRATYFEKFPHECSRSFFSAKRRSFSSIKQRNDEMRSENVFLFFKVNFLSKTYQ